MLISLFLLPTVSAASDVLFVGNSYTFYNNLETLVAEVFEAAGETVTTRRLTSGGLRLENHVSRASDESTDWYAQLVTEASSREWVVLQDQSQIPGFPRTSPDWVGSRDAAIVLDDLVESAGAQTLFFLTWGYVEGDSGNEWLYPDYSTMQSLLQDGYLAYAAACATAERPVWVAPVGPAFGRIRSDLLAAGEDPLASGSLFRALYTGDGSHPSRLGSQLAAYVFFASLSGESPVGLPAPDGLDPGTILTLQEAAASVVFDPADAFTFLWEIEDVAEDSDAFDSDSGEATSGEDESGPGLDTGGPPAEDSGVDTPACVEDSGTEAPSSPTDSGDASSDGGSDYGSQVPPSGGGAGESVHADDDGTTKRGCSIVPTAETSGLWLVILPFVVLARREMHFR